MATTIRVPLNTMLADLDETVRRLLRREFGGRGFDGVEIAFDAPSREWSAQLSSPTVNLFLYDVRQSEDHRPADWDEVRLTDGRTVETRPPLRLAATYAVTAWTREVEDEHRLLSQVLAILYAYDTLPADLLAGGLADPAAQPFPLRTRVAEPRQSGSPEFWSSIGGSYKASLDFGVTLSCDSGTAVERGPEVRSHTLRLRNVDGGRSAVEDLHTVRGTVRAPDGAPVADAWVVDAGARGWVATDEAGAFVIPRMRAGDHELRARAPDGREGTATARVPGGAADIVVGAQQPRRRRRAGA
ncbi:Pvc16 family protein [Miltoncostaea marina]|uniref:Pvc16 family protein n=1 Tax=Miltoncostaea marina TaxID=2843215 RepID=UPI001C3CC057|nr:Pvc16 family protein [Miltoncostaea marina]